MTLRCIDTIYTQPLEVGKGFDLSLVEVHEGDSIGEVESSSIAAKVMQIALTVFYYLFFPVTFPLKCLVEYSGLLDAIMRLTLFPTDLYRNEFGMLGEGLLCLAGYPTHISPERLSAARDAFTVLGAEFVVVHAADDQGIEVMRLTQNAFRKAVEKEDGTFHEQEGQTLIKGGNKLLRDALESLGWPKVGDDFQFCKYEQLKEGNSDGVILRVHPYTYFSMFEKKHIINQLALGKDYITYDSRGFNPGDKLLSEAGAYRDISAVYDHVKTDWGYKPEDMWITAKCAGAAAVSFLRARYLEDDFNVLLENSFVTYAGCVTQNAPFADWIGLNTLEFLKAPDLEKGIEEYVDGFNNEHKWKMAAAKAVQPRQSTVVIISTDTDHVAEPDSGCRLAELARKDASHCYHLVHKGIPGQEGHPEASLLRDDLLFHVQSQIITGGTRIVDINCRGDII